MTRIQDCIPSCIPGRIPAMMHSPIFWLAAAMLAASIGGCIVTIVLALGHPDEPVPSGGDRFLSVPER